MTDTILDPSPYQRADGTHTSNADEGFFAPRDGVIVQVPALHAFITDNEGNDEVRHFAGTLLSALLRSDDYSDITPAHPVTVFTAIEIGEKLLDAGATLPDVGHGGDGALILLIPGRAEHFIVYGPQVFQGPDDEARIDAFESTVDQAVASLAASGAAVRP